MFVALLDNHTSARGAGNALLRRQDGWHACLLGSWHHQCGLRG
jgi:hypothetical protein